MTEPTREIPRVRPTGYVPAPKTQPARAVSPPPARVRDEPDYRLDILTTDDPYPDPRSKNPLHVYGPAIFVVGALAFVAGLLYFVLRVLGVL